MAEAAVIPVEDDDGLLRVGAIVAAADGSEAGLAERVADGARACLRSHELPRTIVVSPSLPTTASGKLDRPRAAAMLAAARPRHRIRRDGLCSMMHSITAPWNACGYPPPDRHYRRVG